MKYPGYPLRPCPIATVRTALQIGHLTKSGKHWAFGRRLFRARTVNHLIDAGEALRIGDHVVAWRPA